MAVMICPCQSLTLERVAVPFARYGGVSGAPIAISMTLPSLIGSVVGAVGKRRPTGTTGTPVSRDSLAAP